MQKLRYESPNIQKMNAGLMNKFGTRTEYEAVKQIDGVSVKSIIEQYGSPVFVISERTIRRTYLNFCMVIMFNFLLLLQTVVLLFKFRCVVYKSCFSRALFNVLLFTELFEPQRFYNIVDAQRCETLCRCDFVVTTLQTHLFVETLLHL